MPALARYIVDDVDAAIAFYTELLGFELRMHPAPPFAEIARGDLHLYLTAPGQEGGGGASLPAGERQAPGGWNRIHLVVDDLATEMQRLQAAGASFRSPRIHGTGGDQILHEDPSGNLVELFEPNPEAYRGPE